MAVLVEGISVVVRRDAVDRINARRWSAFVDDAPNSTLCTDGKLACVSFMAPEAAKDFVGNLERRGLQFQVGGKCADIAVVDQVQGPTIKCDWLEFARLPMGSGKVAACWFFEGERIASGIHMTGSRMELATPSGWKFEGSLSEKFTFVPEEDLERRLKYLGTKDGIDVFTDRETGREVYKPSTRR